MVLYFHCIKCSVIITLKMVQSVLFCVFHSIDASSMDSRSSSNNDGTMNEFSIFISTSPGQFQVTSTRVVHFPGGGGGGGSLDRYVLQ